MIVPSSYKMYDRGKSTDKKTVKTEKTVGFIDGFQLYKTKNIIYKLFLGGL